MALSWSSGKSESASPPPSRVGTRIRSVTLTGDDRRISAAPSVVTLPVVAAVTYNSHQSCAKRPHVDTDPSADVRPALKNTLVHSCLSTPRPAEPTTLWPNSEVRRSFQVMSEAIASTLGSYPATSSESAPPYEPPATPTRGSPAESSTTSGSVASLVITAIASATSNSGEFIEIWPVDFPKPRAL
ncbi:unannotated protein [freshwater metagenome]|uniref:Unannotated protein n=1 Tax=freshwater metagenome TaxID=449393 RepID=A0A6J7KX26_9ZZZZ